MDTDKTQLGNTNVLDLNSSVFLAKFLTPSYPYFRENLKAIPRKAQMTKASSSLGAPPTVVEEMSDVEPIQNVTAIVWFWHIFVDKI